MQPFADTALRSELVSALFKSQVPEHPCTLQLPFVFSDYFRPGRLANIRTRLGFQSISDCLATQAELTVTRKFPVYPAGFAQFAWSREAAELLRMRSFSLDFHIAVLDPAALPSQQPVRLIGVRNGERLRWYVTLEKDDDSFFRLSIVMSRAKKRRPVIAMKSAKFRLFGGRKFFRITVDYDTLLIFSDERMILRTTIPSDVFSTTKYDRLVVGPTLPPMDIGLGDIHYEPVYFPPDTLPTPWPHVWESRPADPMENDQELLVMSFPPRMKVYLEGKEKFPYVFSRLAGVASAEGEGISYRIKNEVAVKWHAYFNYRFAHIVSCIIGFLATLLGCMLLVKFLVKLVSKKKRVKFPRNLLTVPQASLPLSPFTN